MLLLTIEHVMELQRQKAKLEEEKKVILIFVAGLSSLMTIAFSSKPC
jgi:hypothetical protein